MSHLGYWVDLEGISFDEENRKIWIQAFPVGSYKHPLYGKIEMTPRRVQQMAANVQNNVRGTELDIDYDHKEHSGKAAGWIKDAHARTDGLWVEVEFTDDAFSAIKKKEYRYFSPEYADKWTHPSTGAVHQDVLFGGGLTNRPFLKDILPINMSELADEGVNEVDEFLKQLRETLGLNEDATEDEILQAAQAAGGGNGEETEEEESTEETSEEESEDDSETEEEQQLGELKSNPIIKKILSDNKQLRTSVKTLEASNQLAEVNKQLTEWQSNDGSKKYAIPPAIEDDLRKVLVGGSAKLNERVIAVFDSLLDTGLVRLSESGGNSNDGRRTSSGGSATKAFTDRVDAYVKQDKLTYREAASLVASEDPQLWEAHRAESMEGAA